MIPNVALYSVDSIDQEILYHSAMVSPLRLPRSSYLPCSSQHLSHPEPSSNVNGTYLSLKGEVGQDTWDQAHVDEREPGMAGSPAEVLVAVGVEFCRRALALCSGRPKTPATRYSQAVIMKRLAQE